MIKTEYKQHTQKYRIQSTHAKIQNTTRGLYLGAADAQGQWEVHVG